MKSPGGITPRTGWFQRTSASNPRTLWAVHVEQRLIVDFELVLLDGAVEVEFQGPAGLHLQVHLGLEESERVAAGGFGPV